MSSAFAAMAPAAWAEEGVQAWLLRMQQAQQAVPYQGVFVYERESNYATYRVWQGERDGHVVQRIQDQEGDPHELLQQDGRLICNSRGQHVSLLPRLPAEEHVARLVESYELRMVGRSRVAGRVSTVLALIPRDKYRYGHEWHVDAQTGVLLKAVMINDDGQLLERLQFSHFSTEAPAEPALIPQGPCETMAAAEPVVTPVLAPMPQWLPPGFIEVRRQQVPNVRAELAVSSVLFSDGLSSFSVYSEPMGQQLAADARSQLGPTVAVAHRVQSEQGDVMVTVVGEVPLVAAERVALSMRVHDHATASEVTHD
ncbi:MucB/RseB C-terminal domain-containing protein [Atopomonas sediminilitoris]|uniref:MucB/RseB C-terminal domain-containing protein n=1 Tax=Atopomonas sediminilitoris TaxID=2919919 RepID=UPI001F4DE89D|nr:MucB/RseB C-terminal domain-containing protein [Atopomonas sediminilitoris]MCJ8168597.1 MucB/RseB C-terminal domain-containing protein [Atopomonas sediminilitoris]